MSNSITKVSRIYQNIRAFCRENPECRSLYEARIHKDLICDENWDLTGDLTKKEEHSLVRMCNWLGV
jgi:hypothetical protein